jgi:hypothetical protein
LIEMVQYYVSLIIMENEFEVARKPLMGKAVVCSWLRKDSHNLGHVMSRTLTSYT